MADRRRNLGVAASLVVHVAAGGILLAVSPEAKPALPEPVLTPIEVTLTLPAEPAPAPPPQVVPPPVPQQPPPPEAKAPEPPPELRPIESVRAPVDPAPPPKPKRPRRIVQAPPRPQPPPQAPQPEPPPVWSPPTAPPAPPVDQLAAAPSFAPPAPPAPPAANVAAAAPPPDYMAQLAAWLNRHKRYPGSARSRGQEGTAMLRFTMGRDGRVLSHRIERSSGYALLDEAVVEMVERAQPLPRLPDEMAQARLEIVVPVRFALR